MMQSTAFEQQAHNLLMVFELMTYVIKKEMPDSNNTFSYEDNVEQEILLHMLKQRLVREKMSADQIELAISFAEQFMQTGLISMAQT
ncbi:hypothetical protein [Shewanella morhuae]|uniref:hypothetical protein n=1 Tax=Shewanella morhuae TaxID=365591 RepID=UPI001BC57FA8|nr:hypothetical protein [Shewanella morhuae]GIU12602.1 hypothetical protein TUM4641_31720 [Shewanella morhuae]